MNTQQQYDDQQQALARELGDRLDGVATKCRGLMTDHAIATALIGIGVQTALRTMSSGEVAEWLQSVADELVNPAAGTIGTA